METFCAAAPFRALAAPFGEFRSAGGRSNAARLPLGCNALHVRGADPLHAVVLPSLLRTSKEAARRLSARFAVRHSAPCPAALRHLSVKRSGDRTSDGGCRPPRQATFRGIPTPRFRSAVGPHPAPLKGLTIPPAYELAMRNSSKTNSFFHGGDHDERSSRVARLAPEVVVLAAVQQLRASRLRQHRDEGTGK